MRIKSVECEQFAGIQDRELEFDKGLNLVVGDNECGKSTIVDLIFHTLFKNAKLDGRKDADFLDKYFPKNVNGAQGDIIDGVLKFETENGTYKLKKEWEKGQGSCRLTLPNGTIIKGVKEIETVLNNELGFSAGVFNEIVFASQKRNQMAVESIMRALGKKTDDITTTRMDLTSTLNQVSLETGGVSLDKLESSLNSKMNDLSVKWDIKADAPEGGIKRASYKNKWIKGAGEIAKAYYEVDEVRSKQEAAVEAEIAVGEENSEIQELKINRKNIEKDKDEFQNYIGVLGQKVLLDKAIKVAKNSIEAQEKALNDWPVCNQNLAKALELQKKKRQADIREHFNKAKAAYTDFTKKNDEFEKMIEVDSKDLVDLSRFLRLKQTEESKLSGMNLAAMIKQLGSTPIVVTSVSTGEEISLEDGEINITEAVNINIPGIMEMQLMPQGVDVDAVKGKIDELKNNIEEIYKKYDVQSLEELQDMSSNYSTTKSGVEVLKAQFQTALGEYDWETLKKENESVPEDVESLEEIKKQIFNLCGENSVDGYIGSLKQEISGYEKDYVSIGDLKDKIDEEKKEKSKNQTKLESLGEIPEEYKNISDPEKYNNDLQSKIDSIEKNISSHQEDLLKATRALGEKSAEEYSEELQDKEDLLEAKKNEYKHWAKIYDAFCLLKDETAGNPVEDIENNFNKYLGLISDGGLQVQSMDDKMSVELSSGIHKLTYDILSDGTKDTISLAFRLAMLEHLYPDGNGLAVFDDPFTDMSPKRVLQSCKLIQKFAENNQVIFITCDDKYKDLLEGNVITVEK